MTEEEKFLYSFCLCQTSAANENLLSLILILKEKIKELEKQINELKENLK